MTQQDTQPTAETLAMRHVPQAWIDRAMQIEAAADGLVSIVNDAIQRAEEGSGRLYAANRVQLDKWATQVLEAINLPEPVFVAALTRRAGGDAIPAGEVGEGPDAKKGRTDCKGYGHAGCGLCDACRDVPATPKPPAGGDAGTA